MLNILFVLGLIILIGGSPTNWTFIGMDNGPTSYCSLYLGPFGWIEFYYWMNDATWTVTKREVFIHPLGLLLTVLSVLGLMVTWFALARRWPKHPPGCCPACGYDLRGNAGDACPECGAARAA